MFGKRCFACRFAFFLRFLYLKAVKISRLSSFAMQANDDIRKTEVVEFL